MLTEEPIWRSAGPWTIRRRLPMAAATTYFRGGAVGLDADGNVARLEEGEPTLSALGVCEHSYDNSAGAAGAKHLDILAGLFGFPNSADADEITNELAPGTTIFAADDYAAALTSGGATRPPLGAFEFVDEKGIVWCWVGVPFGVVSVTGTQASIVEGTVGHADLTDSDTTQTIDIGDPLAVDSRVLGHSLGEDTFAAFGGGGTGTATVSVGADADVDAIVAATNVFTGQTGFPKPGTSGVLGYPGAPLPAGTQLNVTFAADTTVAAFAAGAITVRVLLAPEA